MPRVLSMSRAVIVLATLLALGAGLPAAAQSPVYHGVLTIRPAGGKIDRVTGEGSITVKRWDFLAALDSNGMNPATEPVRIAIGETDTFTIPVGAIAASKNGRVFTFRDNTVTRGVRSLRFQLTKSGIWRMRFQIVGVELSRLTLEYPFCQPLAVIVGDDDGFSGIELDRPGGFSGKRLRVLGFCSDTGEWPWL